MKKEQMPICRGIDPIDNRYRRVSDVISVMNTGLLNINPEILAAKAEIGTNVHAAIAEYIEIGTVTDKLTEREFAYFESFRSWYENGDRLGISKNILHIETRLYDSDKMITGCIDGILKKDDKLFLVDWKTSVSANKLTWPTQAAFYVQLIRRNGLCDIDDEVCFLKLAKTGDDPQEIRFQLTDYHYRIADWLQEHTKGTAQIIEDF